jgi:ketosteroid isomerase-like protein
MSLLLGPAILLAATTAADPGAFVDAWRDALRTSAKERVLAALAPDVVVFESGEAEMSREEYAAEHLGADMEFAGGTATRIDSRTVVDMGQAVAVLSRTTTTGTFRGQPVASTGVETMVLERAGETWKIRHIHWSAGRSAATSELTARTLASKLRAGGLVVKERPPVEQPFFEPHAQVLVIGDDELQVFEFPTATAAQEAAASVEPDGATIGTSSMHWMAPPHFYRHGRLVVLHLGSSPAVADALGKALGAPFAGRK